VGVVDQIHQPRHPARARLAETLSDEKNMNDETTSAPVQHATESTPTHPMRWYVAHTYSGMRTRCARNIQKMINASGVKDHFGQIVVPTERSRRDEEGEEDDSQRGSFFPSYILIEMFMSDEAFHLVSDLPGVTGFVGTSSGPQPLSKAEVERISRPHGQGAPDNHPGDSVHDGRTQSHQGRSRSAISPA